MSKWTKKELQKLLKMLDLGNSVRDISTALKRKPGDVKNKIKTTDWRDVAEGGDGIAISRPWTDDERIDLFERKNAGVAYVEIGRLLRRTGNSCEKYYNSFDWDDFFKDKEVVTELDKNISSVVDEMLDDKVTKASDGYKKKIIEELSGRLTRREVLFERLKELVPHYPIPKYPRVHPAQASTSADPEEAVLVLSDMQIGELVEPYHTSNLGTYNNRLFVSRMENLKQSIGSIVTKKMTNHNLTKLHVLLLGDIVEGKDIYEGQQYHTDLNVGQQVITANREISECLIYLSSLFDNIQVSCIRGNHGRITKNSAPEENYDTIVYHMVELSCQKLVEAGKMSFMISDSTMEIIDINGWGFLIMHGDGIKGANGLPYNSAQKFEDGQYKMSRGQFQYMVFGHHHRAGSIESNTGGEIICNGAWVGGSNLSINKMALTSRPRQAFFGVHADLGKTWEYMIYLNKGESGWNSH